MVIRCFFQAEEGIRDRVVTRVQTCALPICSKARETFRAHEAKRIQERTKRLRRQNKQRLLNTIAKRDDCVVQINQRRAAGGGLSPGTVGVCGGRGVAGNYTGWIADTPWKSTPNPGPRFCAPA